jgi:hypothetical protein
VYAKRDPTHLKDRICTASKTAMPERLSSAWEEAEYREDTCRATNGAHIEIY